MIVIHLVMEIIHFNDGIFYSVNTMNDSSIETGTIIHCINRVLCSSIIVVHREIYTEKVLSRNMFH
jgi:hypothetical protein